MNDQATDLRDLVRDRSLLPCTAALRCEGSAAASGGPLLLAITGGKGGVGVSTIALGIALSLAREGWRTALVDADLAGGDLPLMCGTAYRYGLAEVISGQRSIHEALVRGPAGLHLLGSTYHRATTSEISALAVDRFLRQLRNMQAHFDFVVCDTGSGATRMASHLWRAADEVQLICSPHVVAVTDAYATIKMLQTDAGSVVPQVIVNLAESAAQAHDVHERLSNACRRFLGLRLGQSSHIPADATFASAAAAGHLAHLDTTHTLALREIARLAEELAMRRTRAAESSCLSGRGSVGQVPLAQAS